MKALFGLVGLLLALVIVGVVVKKQLDTTSQRVPALAPTVPGGTASAPAATVREQSQQVQQQYKQAVEGLMQQPRPTQDEI